MSCNGVCERYIVKRNYNIPSRYTKGQKDVVYARFLLNGMKIARVTITFISSQSQAKHMKFRHIMLVTTTIRHHLQQQK
jgi:hypothetical protein